jgi:hypothetical protein
VLSGLEEPAPAAARDEFVLSGLEEHYLAVLFIPVGPHPQVIKVTITSLLQFSNTYLTPLWHLANTSLTPLWHLSKDSPIPH